ncbi:MAG: patatin-like phospholipase family protein [Candidatus Nanopelagicales bacterium]
MDPLALAARLPRPVAFVLGGGGSWGAVQLGMLRALAQTDLTPDLIVGTSVGSLNGVIVAADPHAAVGRLDEVWPRVTRAEVFPGGWIRGVRTLTESKAWIYDNQPLADLLVGQLPARTFEALQVPFVAVATDFWTGALVELDSGDLRSALLASSAIPGVFPWIEREGRRLVDGMLVANVPLTVARSRGARSLVVLDCGLGGMSAHHEANLVDVMTQSAAIYARRQLAGDLLACADVPVVWLSRGRINATTQLDFSATETLISEGYTQAMATLHEIDSVRALPFGVYGAPAELRADERLGSLLR